MSLFLSERQFLAASKKFQHKRAAQWLKKAIDGDKDALHDYRCMEEWLGIESIDMVDFQKVSDRYHEHLQISEVSIKEHRYLENLSKKDTPSQEAFLPVAIYLDNLRSAFNVGSILRTTEAFRLGALHFGKNTPFIDKPQVIKTSMGTFDKVATYHRTPLASLPRPIIGLETVHGSPTIYDFVFPESFSLMLGNEEYGLCEEVLSICDYCVHIPLQGFKNSLNVASAYAIAAFEIRRQAALRANGLLF